jgi:hypothetical protein
MGNQLFITEVNVNKRSEGLCLHAGTNRVNLQVGQA